MIMSHPEIIKILQRAILGNWKVLLAGRPGTGKTSMVIKAAKLEKIKMSEIAILTAPLIDPFTDLIGIPIPKVMEDGTQKMQYARPEFFSKAKVIFIDEVNRAPPKTVNAVLELIQFGSLMGIKLPHLKTVLIAGNDPEEGLLADPFEHALVDRVDIVLHVPYIPDTQFFEKRFTTKLCNALLTWWKDDLDDTQKAVISPRRLEHIGANVERGIPPQLADTTKIIGSQVNIPWQTLAIRTSEGYIPLEEFSNDAIKYSKIVEKDFEIANKFLMMLPIMNTIELYKTKEITLCLPPELLKSLHRGEKRTWLRILNAIELKGSKEECKAFKKLCGDNT